MDDVSLNGKKSTLVKGLLIQSLPIISKPLIRANIEEIDGRDGDIVTKLGYSAYDRTMQIGLFGDFDIYEVLNYFNSEGEAIFSNEPDKLYKYKILNQIDFEKLLRFRQATVTFHCQPFKYSALADDATKRSGTNITVYNYGNVDSRPNFDIEPPTSSGIWYMGESKIWFDDVLVMTLAQPLNRTEDVERIIINNEEMNAINYDTGNMANRYVTCDFLKLRLTPGQHVIKWTNIDYIRISKISRWI